MPDIHIDASSAERMMKKAPEEMKAAMKTGMQRATLVLERQSAIEAPADTGKLRNSISSEFTSERGRVFSSALYADYVHRGTKPHHVDADELKGWAKRKGLNPYAVMHAIRKKGTKSNPFFERALEKKKNAAVEAFKKAIDDAIKKLKGE